jgi:hypothetical protein
MIVPKTTNAHNMGDWGKQWSWNFGYVHASTGTDLYVISYPSSYAPDTEGKSIVLLTDGAGLQENANGGEITLETAAASGTGIRGKITLNGRLIDLTNKQIKNLAEGTDDEDAVNKSQLDAEAAARIAADNALYDSLIIDEKNLSLLRPTDSPVQIRNYYAPEPLGADPRYIAIFRDVGLTFIDCRNPYSIREIKSIDVNTGLSFDGFPQWVTSVGNYVFMCSNNGKVHVFDWTDRDDPVRVPAATRTFLSGQHFDMASNGVDTLFLGNTNNNSFIAVDISDPLNMTLINSVNLGSFCAGVAYYGGYAYAAAFAGSVRVFEFDGSAWVQIANVPSIASTSRLAVGVNSIGDVSLIAQRYNTNEFAIHSLANLAIPGAAGTLIAPAAVNIYARAFVSDGLLHLSTSSGDLLAYDIADPIDTRLVGTFVPPDVDGNKIFDLGLGIQKFKSAGALFQGKEFMVMAGRLFGQTNPTRNITVIPLPLFPDAVKQTSLSEVAGAWKRNTISLTSADILNGYITLTHAPSSESKMIVSVAQGVDLVFGIDYTVDKANKRIVFEADTLALITSLYNEYSTLTFLAAYFAQN